MKVDLGMLAAFILLSQSACAYHAPAHLKPKKPIVSDSVGFQEVLVGREKASSEPKLEAVELESLRECFGSEVRSPGFVVKIESSRLRWKTPATPDKKLEACLSSRARIFGKGAVWIWTPHHKVPAPVGKNWISISLAEGKRILQQGSSAE